MTTIGDEKPSKAKHVAAFYTSKKVIEASLRIITLDFELWKKKRQNYEVWRNKSWTNDQRRSIAFTLLYYKADLFGFWKLFIHFFDLVISKIIKKEIYFFRRFFLWHDDTPLCYWIYSFAVYKAIGYLFNNYKPQVVDPDTMRDCVINDDEWVLVHKVVNNEVTVNNNWE